EQIAEIDGCFVEWASRVIGLTMVEAKKMRSGAKTAAVKSLDESIKRLGLAEHVGAGQIASEQARAGMARAWIQLEIRRPWARWWTGPWLGTIRGPSCCPCSTWCPSVSCSCLLFAEGARLTRPSRSWISAPPADRRQAPGEATRLPSSPIGPS